MSVSAVRPVCSTSHSALLCSRCASGSRCRTAPTCKTMTLTAWVTVSCSSRAIRARSCAIARHAASSRSSSARTARCSAASACWARCRKAKPAHQTIANSSGVKRKSLLAWPGLLLVTITAPQVTMARPSCARRLSSGFPSRNAAIIPAMTVLDGMTTSRPSAKDAAAATSQTAAGAANGKRRLARRGSTTSAIAGTVNQGPGCGCGRTWRPSASATVLSAATITVRMSSANRRASRPSRSMERT
jgi:hypothetical protein